MAQADGSIRIEAIVSDEKAKKKLDQLNAKLRRQTESVTTGPSPLPQHAEQGA